MAFQLDANIPLLARSADVASGVQRGLEVGGMLGDLQRAKEAAPIRQQMLEQQAQQQQLVAQQAQQQQALADQDRVIGSIANSYSGVKSLVDSGKFNEAADALEANREVLRQSGVTNFNDTDEAIAAFRSSDPKAINRIKLLGEKAIQLATDRGIGAATDERFSPTTTSLPGGISIQTTSTGRKVVTDAGGNVLSGKAATDAITAAEEAKTQRAIAEAGGKKAATVEAEAAGAEGVEAAKARGKASEVASIKEQERIGTTRGEIADNINKAAIQSRSSRPAVVAVRTALEAIDTGKLAQAKTSLGSFIPGLDVSDEQVMQAQITQFVLDTLAQQSGTKTDFDFQKAEEASASLGKTTEANKAILDILIKNLDRTIEEQNQFKSFKRGGGVAEDFQFRDEESENRLNELRSRLGL